ncbi:MAG: hypothetical protein M1822_006503 [Bathelium mastoideum]|nr:MAG: hypothetical protein M1822_006503 [Bathelium mastoideum]
MRELKRIEFLDLVKLEESDSILRYKIAKFCAATWYLIAYASCVGLIGIVLFLTAKAELSIQWLPEAETKKAVGQWAPWIALLLGLAASLVSRIRDSGLGREHAINLNDLDLEDSQSHVVALKGMIIADKQKSLWRYIICLAIYEWQDFRNWWNNTLEASRPDIDAEDGLQDEEHVWHKLSGRSDGLPVYEVSPGIFDRFPAQGRPDIIWR